MPCDVVMHYAKVSIKPRGNFVSALWNDGSIDPGIVANGPGLYWALVTDHYGCAGRDSILLNAISCPVGFFVPGAFTRNHDGFNDTFRPSLFGDIGSYLFRVYERWGNLVFQTTDPDRAWDGKYRGTPFDPGTFAWYCEFQLNAQPVLVKKRTTVLIR
ncbi:MAG: T9SS type B sorting domain-containing protein [Chitinophagaceae bacterium]|nr:MAG: T9SS type B sorting domain-containing protein [Chitinophagaceae bacterium]